jgi:mono/diheme cytochrome c family protein
MGGTYPPLDGSPIVLGDSGVLARVLLHGLEGPVTRDGVTWDNAMVKAPFRTDEELAAVMTYLRRAWGNTADPVSPDIVAEVRRETAGRSTPWTIEELEGAVRP